ncbi:MAG: head GIN domain-containing protein [Telluria sp.]
MRTLISIACLALLGGCAIIINPDGDGDVHVRSAFSSDPVVEGNGSYTRDVRTIGDLPNLAVNGSMLVDVRVGPAPSLVVEADSNLLPLVRTETNGDTLRISSERLHSHNPVHIIYTVPRLASLHANGSGRITVDGLNGAPLEAHLNGSGSVELAGDVAQLNAQVNGSGRLDAARLRAAGAELSSNGSGFLYAGELRGEHASVGVHGSGKVQARGVVRSLTVHTTGSGSADLEGLLSDRADLSSTGSGGITANVRENLVASTSGSGSIHVRGNPAQRNISGRSVHLD